MQKLLSIIVPVYNTEKYLGKCLDSLVNQSLQEIEIIIVNDGSTDKSGDICKNYQIEFPDKIIYFEQPNKGVAAARNLAIENVKTKYLTFVDSDDWLELDAYEKTLSQMITEDVDLLEFGNKQILTSGKIIYFSANRNMHKDIPLYPAFSNFLFGALWNKIYKTEIFIKNNIRVYPFKFYEDTYTVFVYLAFCKKISYSEHYVYNYRPSSSSLSSNYKKIENLKYLINAMDYFIMDFKKRDIFEKNKDFINLTLIFSFYSSSVFIKYEKLSDRIYYIKHTNDLLKTKFGINVMEYFDNFSFYQKIYIFLISNRTYWLSYLYFRVIYSEPIIKFYYLLRK